MRGNLDEVIGGFSMMGGEGCSTGSCSAYPREHLPGCLLVLFEAKVERVTYLQFVRRFVLVSSPGLLLFLATIPFVGEAAVLMAFIWTMLAAAITIQLTFEAPLGLGVNASSIGMVAALVLSLPTWAYLLH